MYIRTHVTRKNVNVDQIKLQLEYGLDMGLIRGEEMIAVVQVYHMYVHDTLAMIGWNTQLQYSMHYIFHALHYNFIVHTTQVPSQMHVHFTCILSYHFFTFHVVHFDTLFNIPCNDTS